MFDYFYHQRIRKAVATFGAIFNDIHIVRTASSGETISQVRVPLSYGPKRSFLDRIQQTINGEDNERTVAIKLPRMSFEISSITYDASRQVSKMNTQTITGEDGKIGVFRQSAPYTLAFDLNVYAKSQDDALQVVEQIIPFFTPHYTISIKPFENYPTLVEDTPLTLSSVSFTDDYDGSLDSRRTIVYTLSFEMKVNFYANINEAKGGLIQEVIVNYGNLSTEDIFETRWYTGTQDSDTGETTITEGTTHGDALFVDDIGILVQAYSSTLSIVSSVGIGTGSNQIVQLDSSGKLPLSIFPEWILNDDDQLDTKYDKTGGTIYGSIIPSEDLQFSLGSSSYRWKDLYLGGDTIYFNNITVKNDGNGVIKFFDDRGNIASAVVKAQDVIYNNEESFLLAENVKDALDELSVELESNKETTNSLYNVILKTECRIPVSNHKIFLAKPSIGDVVYGVVRIFDSENSCCYEEVTVTVDSADNTILHLVDDFDGCVASVSYMTNV